MQNPKYVKFKDVSLEHRFRLQAENGEPILKSEGYVSSSGCDNGIQSVRENSPIDSRYERKISINDKYYFNLKATNGQVIGTSEMYNSKDSRENGISAVKKVGPSAPVQDLT